MEGLRPLEIRHVDNFGSLGQFRLEWSPPFPGLGATPYWAVFRVASHVAQLMVVDPCSNRVLSSPPKQSRGVEVYIRGEQCKR